MRQLKAARWKTSTSGHLPSSGWLTCVPETFAQAILEAGILRRVGKASVLYRIGDRPCGLYGVVDGCLELEQAPLEQGPAFAGLIGSGGWTGETELFDDSDRLSTVLANRDSTVLFVPKQALFAILARDPKGWRWLGALASMHFRDNLASIDDLMLRNPRERIMAILLHLAGVRTASGVEPVLPRIDVTQSKIARVAALSRSTVSQHLARFESEGLISCAYGEIVLNDIQAMRDRLETTALAD